MLPGVARRLIFCWLAASVLRVVVACVRGGVRRAARLGSSAVCVFGELAPPRNVAKKDGGRLPPVLQYD